MATDAPPRSNGTPNGNGSKPESPPRVVFTQQSFSGTPRGQDGLTAPDEYVWELMDVRRRMDVFEEMGNDGAIATALSARCQEVYAANWQLASEDESDRGTEILDYVQSEIDEHIEELLRWLTAGPLQYGFVSIEPVFEWKDQPDGSRRIGIRKLAHIRQVTIELHITETGDLDFLRQRVWDGVSFIEKDIPASKVLFRTYDREGADFYGKPPLRRIYKEWKFKTQLEKINLLHFDRFGSGVVQWTEPKEGLVPAERDRLQKFGMALRAGAENSISVPSGTGMEIKTASGDLASAELAWVQEYNSRVAKVLLTQGTDLGTTDTGSRAVGQTFEEQLAGAVQADAESIASIILEKLIRPLVDYNFGEQEVYPEYSPSQRAKARTGFMDELTKAKAAGVFHATPADEFQFRDRYELPEIPLEDLQKQEEERQLQAAAVAVVPPGNAAAGGGPPPADRSPSDRPPRVAASQRTEIVRALVAAIPPTTGGPTPALRGESKRTVEFSEWEQRILQPDLLSRQLDLETSRTTAETSDVLRAIDDYLATQAEKAAAGGAVALRDFNPKVPNRLRVQLTDALSAAADRVREFGANAVRREIRLQLGPAGVGPQRPTIPTYPLLSRVARALRDVILLQQDDPRDIQLSAEIKRAAEEEIDRREQSARGSIAIAFSQWSPALAAAALAQLVATALRSAFDSLSTNRTSDNVQRVVNTSFGIGRAESAEAINAGGKSGISDPITGKPVELVKKIYSAVMDFGTCDECAKWDAAEFPMDYPEDVTGVQAPNPRCAGGARCRCLFVYTTSAESAPNVPASKGPVPNA